MLKVVWSHLFLKPFGLYNVQRGKGKDKGVKWLNSVFFFVVSILLNILSFLINCLIVIFYSFINQTIINNKYCS